MATTHVFIVNTTTFKNHLEYQFAGTGAAPKEGGEERYIDFNSSPTTSYHPRTEDNLVSMIADSQRVRKNDYVIFYLQQDVPKKIYEGKFYGIFKIKEDLSFLDNYDDNQFLKNELGKSLTFRTLVEPYEVYAKGITEWEALDEIRYIQAPNQMLWSLIYRKLKGNRGNTMITHYETDRLFKLLRDKNGKQSLNGTNFTFDLTTQEVKVDQNKYKYTGRKDQINVLPRLIRKYAEGKSFEPHLQTYIVQNIGRNTNPSLDRSLLNGAPIEWIGNEVSCGVGMQRIDVMLSIIKNNTKIAIAIELKPNEATTDTVFQLQRYVNWLEQYYIPNRISDVQPVLISRRIVNKDQPYYLDIINSFKEFNRKNNKCLPLKYVEYELKNNNLEFQEEIY